MGQRLSDGGFRASRDALVGRYVWRPDVDEWTWSDDTYRLFGFSPGQVVPSTELVMRHIHPADREAAWESREAVVEQGRPFSFLHRIITASGAERVVMGAGHLEDGADGAPVVAGHLIDLTDVRAEAVAERVDTAVTEFAAHRAVIEQAKGVLVQLYSVDPDTAFAVLKAYSMDANRKVRDVASLLVAAAGTRLTPTRGAAPAAHDVLLRLHLEHGSGSSEAATR